MLVDILSLRLCFVSPLSKLLRAHEDPRGHRGARGAHGAHGAHSAPRAAGGGMRGDWGGCREGAPPGRLRAAAARDSPCTGSRRRGGPRGRRWARGGSRARGGAPPPSPLCGTRRPCSRCTRRPPRTGTRQCRGTPLRLSGTTRECSQALSPAGRGRSRSAWKMGRGAVGSSRYLRSYSLSTLVLWYGAVGSMPGFSVQGEFSPRDRT